MRSLYDKQNRIYMIFIGLFCLGTVLVCLSAGLMQGPVVRDSLFQWERTTASSLLAQGVDAETVAEAFRAQETTDEGERLLEQIGHTDENMAVLFPESRTVMLRMGISFFFAGAVLSVLLVLASFLFLKMREQSYENAADIIERYAQGDFGRRLTRGGTGDLNHLFAKVDQLATALRAKSESEARAKEFLKDTITDISHQLKTPLAALNMYMEIISADSDQPDTVRQFAGKSISSLERMERLIYLLLKVMRLDSGNVTFALRPVSIGKLAETAAKDLYVKAEAENKQIIFEGDWDETLVCDADWTAEAIANLIKNGLDHIQSGGFVKVSWRTSAGMVRICVEDNGTGIEPGDIHHIFKRFYRSRNSSDSGGVGLGLPLARSIIEGQGGVLSVESAPGEGTAFTLSISKTAAPATMNTRRSFTNDAG